MRITLLIFASALLFSFADKTKGEKDYQGLCIGKKVSETPLGDYIKSDLTGDHMIMFVRFDCSECEDAIKEANVLKDASMIKSVIVIGSSFGDEPADSIRDGWKPKIKYDEFYDFDPEFKAFYKKLLAYDKDYPQVKHFIYVKDNVIQNIFLHVPDEKKFAKIKKNN